MLRSMTGFARASAESESYRAEVEIRSVNHRYLDVRVKTPAGLSAFEIQVRDRIAVSVTRGKLDVLVRVEPKGESTYELEVDRPLLREFVDTVIALAAELGVEGKLTVSDVVGFGYAFNVRERDLSGREQVWRAVSPALEQALSEHDRMRRAEGESLHRDLGQRMEAIGAHLDAISESSTAGRERKRQELGQRVQEIAGALVEPAALAMEVARLVERADISEEVTRFRSHLGLWDAAITAEGPCGKKLDFIVQEMNREVNTIGSKSQDAAVTERVIAIKSELERVREQVQNIE